jgi:glycosyltransferase involved in cell wall biosynthesis
MTYLEQRASPTARVALRVAGTVAAQIVETFLCRHQYRTLVARADRLGLPLAGLFKLARARRDLVLISAWLSRRKKAVFLRPLGVHSHLAAIVNYSSIQMHFARERLGVPGEKLHHARQPVDERFWQPVPDLEPENLVCAVGSEARDYATLLEAVRGLDVRVEVAVGTTVFQTGDVAADLAPTVRPLVEAGLPPNVSVHQQLDHLALRRLYARSRVVVVPLHDVLFDPGVTSIAEAMAMGKPVVVTRARGQVDLVREGETGLYVPPADPRALREAVERLLHDPAEAERLGREGRRFAENELRLDRWVDDVTSVVEAASAKR